jgi:hypothetical protein
MLQLAAAPAHHDRHPQPKIHAQKLIEKAAVGITASAKAKLCRNRCVSKSAVDPRGNKSWLGPLLVDDRPNDDADQQRQQGHSGHDHQKFRQSDASHDQSIRPVKHESSIPSRQDQMRLEIARLADWLERI